MNNIVSKDIDARRRELLMMRLKRSAAPRAASFAPPAISRANRNAPLPLSFAQQRLWFLDQLDPNASLAYHMPAALRLDGDLDHAALRAALNEVVARHEALRTTFATEAGDPVQVVGPADAGFPLAEQDLSHLDAKDREEAVERISREEVAKPFSLGAGPLVRGQLLRLGQQSHILLVTQHHIVSDGWSIGVLVREIGALYAAFVAGKPSPLPPMVLQYADYAAWQRGWLQGEVLAAQTAFWKDHLGGAPAVLDLPTDRPRQLVRANAGGVVEFSLPAKLAETLRQQAQRHGATLFMSLFAAWSLLLARLSGQGDVVVGTAVANRQRTEIEHLMGFFVNTLALRTRIDEDTTVGGLLASVRQTLLGAYDHQDLPFEQIVDALQPTRSTSYSPIFQAMFSMNNTPGGALDMVGLEITPLEQARNTTQFDISMMLTEAAGGIGGSISYAADLFDVGTVQRIASSFVTIVTAMAEGDERKVNALPLMDAVQHSSVALLGNASGDFDANFTIHGRFEEQAAAQPDAIALIVDGQQMTYEELNSNANRMAHRLLELGVQPDDRVAICAERGFGMIAGLLAIMKAGAGYVPLDPVYPDDRLAFMLGDCAPRVVLADSALASRLDVGAASLMLLDDDFCAQPAHNPALEVSPSSLAYVIYTSGSTGLPKGVMIEHRNVARLMTATDHWFGFGPSDVWTLFHSFAFDFSVWEIWGALLTGGRLVVVPYLASRAPQEFYS
ncbi:Non-ribosomal peptide synthetase component F, partial [Duganella sp. CF458]|uniref:condensation domain-containing protein n=1 Tax=Duganella sp. CF458 TaxID=1884368 RepID=UPI0008EEAD9A